MNPLTLEWIEKAENDLRTARREFRVRKEPNFDAVCFHCQQAVEKYLKAFLQENGLPIPRIHSLADLLAIILKTNAGFVSIQANINVLEGYAVQFRYPGITAEKVEAKAALLAAERIRSFMQEKLAT